MAFEWGPFLNTAIPAVATGVSGYLGYKGATGAAKTQAQAAKDAQEYQRRIFALQQGNLAPYMGTGRSALGALMRGMGMKPFSGPGAGPGAAYGQTSPFGSQMLGNISASAPSSLARTGKAALSGGQTGMGIAGPVGAGVGAAVGTIGSLFGRGRKEADQLVPAQNAVTAEIERIKSAVDAASKNGTLTKENVDEASDTINGLVKGFIGEAKKFGRAGPGAIKTITDAYGTGEGPSDWQKADWYKTIPQAATQQQAPGEESIAENYFTKPFTTEDFVHDPGYEARLGEGQKQIDRFMASRGLASSGGAAKSLSRYGQTFASNEYQNVYNRYQQERMNRFNQLMGLAGMGQQETNVGAGLGAEEARLAGDLITGAGAATAAGQVGGANAITGALTGGANLFSQAMNLRQIDKWRQQNQMGGGGFPTGGNVTYDPNAEVYS